jgi:hypothetical protein
MEEAYEVRRPVRAVFPQSHQELARARHADFLREATQARLAADAHERVPGEPVRRTLLLTWMRSNGRWVAVRTA